MQNKCGRSFVLWHKMQLLMTVIECLVLWNFTEVCVCRCSHVSFLCVWCWCSMSVYHFFGLWLVLCGRLSRKKVVVMVLQYVVFSLLIQQRTFFFPHMLRHKSIRLACRQKPLVCAELRWSRDNVISAVGWFPGSSRGCGVEREWRK